MFLQKDLDQIFDEQYAHLNEQDNVGEETVLKYKVTKLYLINLCP